MPSVRLSSLGFKYQAPSCLSIIPYSIKIDLIFIRYVTHVWLLSFEPKNIGLCLFSNSRFALIKSNLKFILIYSGSCHLNQNIGLCSFKFKICSDQAQFRIYSDSRSILMNAIQDLFCFKIHSGVNQLKACSNEG